ncbi:MAG TPA: TIGR00282 family metallophosphoesterase [Parvularcula sp.]|nr:TIGR00282 family metallophosphoesterase [Parvularcula sp.]HBS30200.1 TIGR00282 family metallophosphoesterase [Parvularcula sp.]HBS36812.1 TIGR00282 family metallophosphoesterase [Parvularcula sp.]
MKIGVFGDIVGRSGRKAIAEGLPRLKRRYGLDFIIVNGENAAGGFGVTAEIVEALLAAGADVVTTGNHAYDQRDDIEIFRSEPRLLRPLNFPKANPGRGAGLFEAKDGRQVMVLHAQGQVEMHPCDDPFAAIDAAIGAAKLGREADAIIVDFHAEATSEKQAMGHYLDGRVTAVLGTHTHTPTADDRVLSGGTAYMSDIGMCGDYDSVIGMEKTEPMRRFLTKMPSQRFQPAAGEATICGVIIETATNGLASSIEPLRMGGCLRQREPNNL